MLVGLPYRLDGSESPSTERAQALLDAIAARLPEVRVIGRDEALTTWAAEERLAEAGVPAKERKARIDAYAALVLLEEELDARRAGPRPAGGSR